MTVSKDEVLWCYRMILGREPESEDVVRVHMKSHNLSSLREAFLRSPEFVRDKERIDSSAIHPQAVFPPIDFSKKLRIAIVGNCQVFGITSLMQTMSEEVITKGYECTENFISGLRNGTLDIKPFIEADFILAHRRNDWIEILEQRIPSIRNKIKLIPAIFFSAFHPDCVYIKHLNQVIDSPIGAYNSSLAFYGWKKELSLEKTVRLFSKEVYEALGFFNYWNSSVEFLSREWDSSGLFLDDKISRWSTHRCWMHSVNHPKLFVLADVARAALAREGIQPVPNVEFYLKDTLADYPCWPVYPEIGDILGIPELPLPYFKKGLGLCPPDRPVTMMGLEEFVHQSFGIFDNYERANLHCERMDSTQYKVLDKFLMKKQQGKMAKVVSSVADNPVNAIKPRSNPYQDLPDYQFWRRSIERSPMRDVDPVVRSGFTLNQADKVATAGSCFAQHISRALQKKGFNYYVSENGDISLTSEEAQRRNFGVFSARFGNLYSARQLVQLFDRAYGIFTPVDQYWVSGDSKFVDPFRPQVEPDRFSSIDDLECDRTKHFSAVREMFEHLDVLVFTLGLTEAWRSRADGAVFPLAPGVVAGEMNSSRYEFVNFSVSDVVVDMQSFMDRLLRVNPKARVLLTVSPVPLIATYVDRHVLVSTTYSKSVLRSAAEEICQHNTPCEYFPSYEIITGNYTKGGYFESDLRSVKSEGVEHVMRLFFQHYSSGITSNSPKSDVQGPQIFHSDLMRENAKVSEIICDEDALDASHC